MSKILSPSPPTVAIELFGLARHKAGIAATHVAGVTVAEVLRNLETACPGLMGLIDVNGVVARQYLVSVDGTQFISDTSSAVVAGMRLLVLGADPGG